MAKSYAVMLQQVVATFGIGSVGPLLENQRVECEIAGVFRNPTLAHNKDSSPFFQRT